MYFWGQKYQNPPHVVFRGIARATALHGARKIMPMRHPVADAPQPAPSFSASNESAELLCRHGRHRVKYQFIPTASFHLLFLEPVFPQGDSRLGSDGERASGGLKARAAGRFACKPAQSPDAAFRRPDADIGIGRVAFAAFRHRKAGKKVFLNFTLKVREVSGRLQFSQTFFFLYFWGQKYQKPPHVVLRGSARAAALHGARKIGALAPPRGGRAAARTLFFRVKRECGITVPPLAAFFLYGNTPLHSFFPQGDPRLGSDGGKADGRLKAPAAGTVCLQTRE